MTDSTSRSLRLAISQFGPRLGDTADNGKRIAQIAGSVDADLLLFPELALTGYDVRDRVHELALPPARLPDLVDLPERATAVVGFIESTETGIPYNAAAVLHRQRVAFVHRKLYLPTYGMFDEGRYFGRGNRVESFTSGGFRFGILICEDLWHPSLCYLHACQQVDAILVITAAPGRGIRSVGVGVSPFTSMDVWLSIACTMARLYGIYVVVCNRVGVESGVSFAGGSLVAGPTGDALIVAGSADEDVLQVEIERDEITRARRPYAHLRDEDPSLVLRGLQRIVGANG